jgi:hypothetical protein
MLPLRTLYTSITWLVYICFACHSAQSQEKQIHGMTIVTLSTLYKYNSGGVPLVGYVLENLQDASSTPKQEASSVPKTVTFLVCNTGTKFDVIFEALVHVDPPCPKSGPGQGLFAEWQWQIDAGKLVANQKPDIQGFNFKDINLGDLPKEYQSMVSASKQGEPAAISFEAKDGVPALGIINKSQM